MYGLGNRAPEEIELIPASGKQPAVKVLFAPVDRKIRRLVLRATRGKVTGSIPGQIEDITDEQFEALLDASEAVSREMIRLCAISWSGIGDGTAKPKPLPLTPAREVRIDTCAKADRPTGSIDAFLDDDILFDAADRLFVKAQAARDAEKNGLSVSLNGTGGAGTGARGTASSRVRAKATGAAKSARTSRTPSKRRKPRASGTS